MCELINRSAKNYSKENFIAPLNTAKKTDQLPESTELVCRVPDYTDNMSVSPSVLQKDALMSSVLFVNNPYSNQDTTDRTIQHVTSTASSLTSTLNKVPGIIANISEIESNSALMIGVSKWAGPTAKIITESKAFQIAGKVVGNPIIAKGAGALGVISGGFEIKNGIKEIYKNNPQEGVYHIFDGTSNAVAGSGLVLGSATVASGGAAFGVGLTVGHFGDKSAKEFGWLKDNHGRAQSVSDRLGDRMWNIHDSVEKSTGSSTLGHIAGLGSGIIMLPTAGIVSVGGALVNGGKIIGGGINSAWNYVFH